MTQPTYLTAAIAADKIHHRLSLLPAFQYKDRALWPSPEILATLIDSAFWTSLRREEWFTPKISLAFVAHDGCAMPVLFSNPLPPTPKDLSKLAAAVERSGIHLCVWPEGEELRVWGIARQLPPLCLVIEIVIPGLLVVKLSPSSDGGKFMNIAVLQGDQIKLVDHDGEAAPRHPLLDRLLRQGSHAETGNEGNVLLRLAISIRSHGHGGLLMVVPNSVDEAKKDEWKKSVVHPISYEMSPAYQGLADLVRDSKSSSRSWEDALTRVIDGVAGLTAVDGAMMITTDYEVLAFGTKIARRNRAQTVSEIVVTESVIDGEQIVAEPAQLGGTRHLAAAQFVHDQRDSIAMVASQDGRFTAFIWSDGEQKVHAHRLDVLLL